MRVRKRVLFVLIAVAAAGGIIAAERPIAVSPGDTSKLALIGDGCPTFSWVPVPGARSHELVVYRLGAEGEVAQSVLGETFTGSASAWAPSLNLCLERGASYAWSVRAIGAKEEAEWSEPNLFQVASGPGEVIVTKTSSAAGAPVVPGQTLTYTMVVENPSSSPVSGVELTDVLPAEVTYVANTTQVTGPEQFFARDVFEAQSYANQDGPNGWNGSWVETDAGGGGPTGGDIQIFPSPGNVELRMEETDSAVERAVGDLRAIGGPDPFAALLFDFRVNGSVDEDNVVEIECASNAPSGTFATVPYGVFDGIEGDVNALPEGRLGYDISGCIAPPPTPPDTAIRLRLASQYGGGEFFFADVLDVKVAGDNREALDDLSSGGYAGGSGWLTDWVESDTAGAGPGVGNVQVVGGQLRLTGPVDEAIVREVDLSGTVFAILSFDYETSGNLDDDDRLRVQVSSTGAAGTFIAIGEFVNDMNDDVGQRSYDITPFISATTAVRFRISEGTFNTGNEFLFFDNVRVKAGVMVSETKDMVGSPGVNPKLLDGSPPVITLPGDSFALAPGDTMTATFDVVADDPLDVSFLTNTALAWVFGNPDPVQGNVTDPAPESVPAITQWATLALAILFVAGLGFLYRRQSAA